jgi:hypothetical protein
MLEKKKRDLEYKIMAYWRNEKRQKQNSIEYEERSV